MKRNPDDQNPAQVDLGRLIAEIIVGASTDDQQFCAFRQVLQDNISLPCDGFVIGQPVSVVAFDYDGNKRRGLTARCRREDGSEHVVAASEVVLPPRAKGIRFLAAYRKWMGLEPWPREATIPGRRQRQHKVAPTDLELTGPVELAVLSVKENAARCRLLGADRILTLRTSGLWRVVSGEIVVVTPGKHWSYADYPYLSGKIEAARLDIAALGLVPLRLKERGLWHPDDHYWGEEGEPIEDWAQPIIARGPRPAFEMEQVVPGMDPDDIDSDPISESNDLKDAGDHPGARRLLMELCQADLRCLDAHAHLGNLVFDHSPKDAIRHFEVGVRIGELSICADFDGLLPWGAY